MLTIAGVIAARMCCVAALKSLEGGIEDGFLGARVWFEWCRCRGQREKAQALSTTSHLPEAEDLKHTPGRWQMG